MNEMIRNQRRDNINANAISIAENSVHNFLKNMPAFNSTFLLDNKQTNKKHLTKLKPLIAH